MVGAYLTACLWLSISVVAASITNLFPPLYWAILPWLICGVLSGLSALMVHRRKLGRTQAPHVALPE